MISSDEFAAYNRAVARIGDKAASDVESSVLAWCRDNASATVAEKREAARLIMDGYIQGYDDIAAEFAAEWYDHRAEKSGIKLDQAITMTTYSPESVDDVARYQAKKLLNGGGAEFAKACGEYARNDLFRSLNETIIANVGRDKDKGARFARVPTGFETCPFCLMLASRNAVYHTRKTAGEFKHFHRHCDCKVVPSFDPDPDAEVVEGVKPKELRERISLMEKQTGLSFADSKASRKLSEFIALHDRDWLMRGKKVKPGYASKQVEKRVTEAEKQTASLLAGFGIESIFIQDYEWVKVDGIKRKTGLPDLKNGIEIKTIGTSGNPYGAIDNYLKSAEKKKNLSCVVVDNSASTIISDEDLIEAASDMIDDYELIPSLYLILKSGFLRRIK